VRLLFCAALFNVMFSAALSGADDFPDWARQAASQTAPTYPPKVFAVVLLHEESVALEPDGRRTLRERGVIKIVQKSAETVRAYRSYDTKSGRIRDFRGWLLPVSGAAKPLGKDAVADIALSGDNTYDEGRARVMSPGTSLPPGTVFAYEVTQEEKSVFTQDMYDFQDGMPVLVSRFSVTAPPGWDVRGAIMNHAPLDPVASNGTYTWELRDLPWIEDERYSPAIRSVVPRLGVTILPGENKAGLRTLKDWRAVSGWMAELADPSAEPSAEVRAKSAELTRGLATEAEKIRAIAKFSQQVNYVSVQLNVTRGGGYTPHRADQVLAHNYGDCKDKSALMRALLQAAGIPSYVTLVDAEDRYYVRPEWPSPQQFDHAIVAIRVSPETDVPTVLSHPRLGRLLIFDPTDSDTPLGDLPQAEQGSHALVAAGEQGELVDLPLLPATANRIESTAQAGMDAAGRLAVHVDRQYFGQAAARAHARVVRQTNDELKKGYERTLGERVGSIAVKQAQISGTIAEGRMQLSLDYSAEHFSQTMPGMMIVKPGALALGAEYFFKPGERKLPVKLDDDIYRDAVRIKLPPGFGIDEMPDAVHLESRYGAYRASWKADGADLVFEQSVEVHDAVVPAEQYPEVVAFFEKIGRSQASAVVLVQK
jgi:transglutaminase-like putative cysteine protease